MFVSLFVTLPSCKTQEATKPMVEEILAAQLKNGTPSDFDVDDYSERDLDATIPVLKKHLAAGGFKFLNNEEFNVRIKKLFKRIVDPNSQKKYLYVNFYDKCARENIYHPNNADVQGLFIIKNENFITDFYALPELINYQKEYPDLKQAEAEKIIIRDEIEETDVELKHWKDLPDLPQQRKENIQTLVTRNKYLFNDSKADLSYLLHNDQNFLKTLVVVFGYDKEPKINELIMQEYEERSHLENPEAVGDILFVKNCEGKLETRQGLLEYITRRTQSEEKRLADALYSFIVTYLKERSQFTLAEKRKIVAYAAQTYEPLYEKFYEIGWPMGSMLTMYLQSDEGAAEEFKKNHYYDLPDLKRYTEKALEQIRVDSIRQEVQEQGE